MARLGFTLERFVHADLRKAYALISEFRRGGMRAGSDVTEEQLTLIDLLRTDLKVGAENSAFEDTIVRVAQADLFWNQQTQDAITRIYELRAAGNEREAKLQQDAFLKECPSSWYTSIVGNL